MVFRITNEKIDAIIKGLNISRGDNILAILGAGDQVLAMLEFDVKILAIEIDSVQIEYTQDRIIDLERNFSDLYPTDYSNPNKGYFSKERLEKICLNLDNLKIKEGNIFDISWKGFNKIYLSNALPEDIIYSSLNSSELSKMLIPVINKCSEISNRGTLIYSSASINPPLVGHNHLKINKKLTRISREYEKNYPYPWTPTILTRK